jgi:hypothetical protein
MADWITKQLAEGFPALAGSRASGTIAVDQALVNELIAQWLAGSDPGRGTVPRVDLAKVREVIKSATVRSEVGKILIDFEIGV